MKSCSWLLKFWKNSSLKFRLSSATKTDRKPLGINGDHLCGYNDSPPYKAEIWTVDSLLEMTTVFRDFVVFFSSKSSQIQTTDKSGTAIMHILRSLFSLDTLCIQRYNNSKSAVRLIHRCVLTHNKNYIYILRSLCYWRNR